ncbi:MAG TPA: DUF1254 domain-containing protein [Candidatus Cybelea sp.]|nr:DUF1254 domain-containing protein [Candidatus Cybelea sp.]
MAKRSAPTLVTPDNFRRAETDTTFAALVKKGALGKLTHNRDVASIDDHSVIRQNRDTLYSHAVFDLDAGPVTVTMPKAGKRYMALQVIDEDQYSPAVYFAAGAYKLERKKIGTRYVAVAIRTFFDPNDAKDVAAAHALQDAIEIRQKSKGRFQIPSWDPKSQSQVRDALLALAATMKDFPEAFGARGEVDPVQHLICTAAGWGGNPPKAAVYQNFVPKKNDGKTVYKVTVKDVPVDGFWSVTVYNARGFFEKNELGAYSVNYVTAKKAKDGAVTIQFGGGDASTANLLPIMNGWNCAVRLYRPRKPIRDGKWTFPEPNEA